MQGHDDGQRAERGQAVSVLVLLWTLALLILAGLVVDGGQQVAAQRRAESSAARAARAGADAAATERLAGRTGAASAVLAAKRSLAADPGIDGRVSLLAGRVHVDTRTSVRPVFLTLLGISQLEARGQAEAELVDA